MSAETGVGFLERLLGLGHRSGTRNDDALEAPALPAPDWVPRDVDGGFVKVRLFLSPLGTMPSLYEVDLPEGDELAAGVLRCFSPPPGDRGGSPDAKSRAWKVDLEEHQVAELTTLAREMSLFPMGGPMPSESAATVELSLTSGQAEARLRWWMSPPREWTEVDRLVARLQELAGSGR